MFTLTADIPPPEKRRSGRPSKYPFDQMEVGHSFFVKTDKPASAGSRIARQAKKSHKIKLIWEARNEDGEAGIRVWRVEEDLI